MNADDLKSYNAQGLVPGPEETEEIFLRRVDYCLKLSSQFFDFIPGEAESAKACDKDALLEMKKKYEIFPAWVPCVFSNYQLMPWQGGCAWIFQKTKDSPLGAFFQIRKAFKNHQTYLKIYSRRELMMHEMVHVGRMAFDEPIYEEFFAYNTSTSYFRRWFGPIIQSPYESFLFVLLLGGILLSEITFTLLDMSFALSLLAWLKLIPVGLILLALVRLVFRHRHFKDCLKQLKKITDQPDALMYRLKDREIEAFAKMTPEAIAEKMKREANATLRQRLLASYLHTAHTSNIGF